ncbi:MAG: hypothetical protein WBO70_06555 [Erysipelotrichaceae bacterium]
MKTQILKNKVEAMLIKNGNNIDDVKEMVNLHFDQASKNFSSVKTISEYIRTIY